MQKIDLFNQVQQFYLGTQAEVEAETGVAEGSIGYATDINKLGSFNGSTWDWAGSGSGFTQEEIEDFVGDMVTGNTETGIAVTYDDTNGKLDFVAEVTQADLDAIPQAPNITRYSFDSSTTAADPGSGDIRFNSTTQASITSLYISQLTLLSGDITRVLEASGYGDVWYIQDAEDATKWIRFTQNAAGTDNGDWWTIPVTYVGHAGALFSNGTELVITLNMSPNPATILDVEGIQDLVGNMVTGNTESGIEVSYDDTSGKLNFNALAAGDARYEKLMASTTNQAITTSDYTYTPSNSSSLNILKVDLSGLTAHRTIFVNINNPGTHVLIIVDVGSASYHCSIASASGNIRGSTSPITETLQFENDTLMMYSMNGITYEVSAAYIPSVYAPAAKGVTNGDSHDHIGGDGAQINHAGLSNIGTNDHSTIDTHLAASAPHSGHSLTSHNHDSSYAPKMETCTAYHNAAQTISTGVGSWQNVALNADLNDPLGWHDPSSNNHRITPVGADGVREYQVLVQLANFASNSTGIRAIRVADSSGNTWNTVAIPAINGDVSYLTITAQRVLASSGYVYVQVYQSSGGNLSLNAFVKVTVNRMT